MNTPDPISKLLALYLAQIKALAETRPDIKLGDVQISVTLDSESGMSYVAAIFYNSLNGIVTGRSKDASDAICNLRANLAAMPKPKSNAERASELRAEADRLEAAQ
jgi:hypothetical protein